MEDKKNTAFEINDEELDEVTGGATKSQKKKGTRTCMVCNAEISPDNKTIYCDKCLKKLLARGGRPIL